LIEKADRTEAAKEGKKTMLWLVSTCVSVLVGIGMVMFSKVFGG